MALPCSVNGEAYVELEVPFSRWLVHVSGKMVLAVAWELSQGCQPGVFLILHLGFSVAFLGLPHSMETGLQERMF